ncbi:MAG: methyltransferase [Bacillota bacterium]|nr:methyltransferase [Bacillota bacterium]
MKSLPVVNNSFKDLYQMFIDSVRSNVFLAGVELKVFNYLTKPMSAVAVAETIDDHPENTRLFLDGLTACNYHRAGIAQEMARIVSKLPEFSSFKKMLDLGGGPGLIGISIIAEHPTMKGVIFDQPAVVKVSESFIRQYEMDDRMEVIGGDYINDSIGESYDFVLASATLNFAKDNIDLMMKKYMMH